MESSLTPDYISVRVYVYLLKLYSVLFSVISYHQLEVVNRELNEVADDVVLVESWRHPVSEVYSVE